MLQESDKRNSHVNVSFRSWRFSRRVVLEPGCALLRHKGHDLWTPTLTGLGERAHLLSPEIDLAIHVQDIVNVLFYEDLHDVVLVGHSAAGAVITAVAEHVPKRIAQLVYLEALIPENGQAYVDLLLPAMWANLLEAAQRHGEGWYLPPSPPQFFGMTNEADAAWVQVRLVPQPLETLTQPLRIDNDQALSISRVVIDCTQGLRGWATAADPVAAAHEWTNRGWGYQVVDGSHDVMITAPRHQLPNAI